MDSGPVAGLEPWVHALAIPGTNMLGHAFPPLTILGMKVPVAEWYNGRRRIWLPIVWRSNPLSYVWVSRKARWEAASLLGSQLSLGHGAAVTVYQGSAPPLVLGLGLLCTCRHEFPMAIL